MLRRLLIPFLLLLATPAAQAQLFYSGTEYGLILGGSQYFGDLNDNYGFSYVRPAGGIYIRQHLNPYISVRGQLTYTKLGYDDAFNSNIYQKTRNLSFRTDLVEVAAQAEFNFVKFATGEPSTRFAPYLTVGVGAFFSDPYTTFGDQRRYLKPLGTEGQNLGDDYKARRYHRVAASFPIGAGFKYWIRPGLNLGFEITDHLTTTDYIDDVSTTYVGADKFPTDPLNPNAAFFLQDPSIVPDGGQKLGRAGKQRGNSSTKDQFMYGILTLSFQLKVYRCPGYLKGMYLED